MNMSNGGYFTIGIVTGVIFASFLFAMTSVKIAHKQFYAEVVNRGYGSWVVDTNVIQNGIPTVKFEWNEKKN